MKSIIIIILVTLFTSSALAKEKEFFYQNPSFENFIESIKDYKENNESKSSKLNNNEQLLSVFITYVLDNNPDYKQKLLDYKVKCPKNLQSIIDNTLKCQNSKYKLSQNCINLRSASHNILRSKDNTPSELMANLSLANLNWEAFYATGDNKYLINLLKFICSQDREVRTISLNLINRGSKLIPMALTSKKKIFDQDKHENEKEQEFLNDLIKENDPKNNKKLIIKVAACYAVLYGLNFNLTIPDIAKRIEDIIKTYPELDYTIGVKLQ